MIDAKGDFPTAHHPKQTQFVALGSGGETFLPGKWF
jgi:hypothetical protein